MPLAVDFANAGKRVVLFERGPIGGTCVNVGCTPSKAFLAPAHMAGRARRASDIGVHAEVRASGRDALERTRRIRDEWRGGVVRFVFNAKSREVRPRDGSIGVVLGDGTTLAGDALLVATGRAPNSAALKPEAGGVACRDGGYIVVDEFLRTTSSCVFAIGDVAGQPAFTHVAWEDYRRVKATIGTPRRKDDRVLSYSTFTEPQLARKGLNESEARAKGIDARSVTLATSDIARGAEWGLTEGFFRLVIHAATERIVGATLVGYEAGEIVHTLALAIHLNASWRDLDRVVGIHPTFGEGLPSLARLGERGRVLALTMSPTVCPYTSAIVYVL